MNQITLNLDDKLVKRLEALSRELDCSVEELLAAGAERLISEKERSTELTPEHIAEIEAGVAELERGETVTHEEAMAVLRTAIS